MKKTFGNMQFFVNTLDHLEQLVLLPVTRKLGGWGGLSLTSLIKAITANEVSMALQLDGIDESVWENMLGPDRFMELAMSRVEIANAIAERLDNQVTSLTPPSSETPKEPLVFDCTPCNYFDQPFLKQG
ncbi:hypothetical protein NE237_005240 [Protea cynaroides]|uniref:Uncharacterized protein n=1 Tax=Protea cynaroides TaxID=273540 RepID=A0A9Q0KL02_9MAGN|nr:hypothetical protein NE237_005240 [Protea cynaroides]